MAIHIETMILRLNLFGPFVISFEHKSMNFNTYINGTVYIKTNKLIRLDFKQGSQINESLENFDKT